MLCLVFVGLIAISPGLVLADIAPDPLSGGKNLERQGKEKTNVAMVDEVVKLKLSRDKLHVDVIFTMKNTGNTAETMNVGFPSHYKDELLDFQATVNGKEVKLHDGETMYGEAPGAFVPPSPSEVEVQDGETKFVRKSRKRMMYWKMWETTFPPGKEVKIDVSYSSNSLKHIEYDSSSTNILLNKYFPQEARDERPDALRKLETRFARYVLVTGSHWSGPIGRCRIELTFDGITADNMMLGNPQCEHPPIERNRDKIVWDIKNYEPKSDFRIAFTPNCMPEDLLNLYERFYKKSTGDQYLVELLAYYRIALGKSNDEDQLWIDLFSPWQEKFAMWGPESEVELIRDKSSQIMILILKFTHDPPQISYKFRDPAKIAPIFKKIALRLKEQTKLAPEKQQEYVKHVDGYVEEILAWCAKHQPAKK